MRIITHSPQETIKFGFKLAKKAKGGQIFALIGDLGGGKTYFAKGFAKGLGFKKNVASPSFILMKVYKIKKGRLKNFCHVDAYRLKNPREVMEIGLPEYLRRQDTVTVIEWANKIKSVLKPYKKTTLAFSFVDKNVRKIKIT